MTAPFEGDAQKLYGVAGAEPEEDGGMREEMRLACLVASVDKDCACVPRGALVLDANDAVVKNLSYSGVAEVGALSAASYKHFRPVVSPKNLVKLGLGAVESLDFLESLTDDVPRGCWAIKEAANGTGVTLSNQVWPGFVAFAMYGSSEYGYAYFGNGSNTLKDISFML